MTLKFTIKHRYTRQEKYNGLTCYGRRVHIPKTHLLTLYGVLSFLIPVVVPVFGLFVLKKFIPRYIRL
jgi:hypothetical protein